MSNPSPLALDKIMNFPAFDTGAPTRTMTLQYSTQMNSSGFVNINFSLKLVNLPVLTEN